MAEKSQAQLGESRTAPLHLSDRPVELRFGFEHRQSRVGVGASMAAHIVGGLIILMVIRFAPQPAAFEMLQDQLPNEIVWLAEEGPGGGGGGGGNKMPDPPKAAELPGKDKITVPVEKKPEPVPEPPKPEPPAEQLLIPAQTMAAAEVTLPGVIQPSPTTPNRRARALAAARVRGLDRASAPVRAQVSGLASAAAPAAARIVQAPASRCRRCCAK